MKRVKRLAIACGLIAGLAAPAGAVDQRVWKYDAGGVRYELTADSLMAQPQTGAPVPVTREFRQLADWKARATLEFARGVFVEYALQPLAFAGPYLSLAVDEYVAPYPALGPNVQRTFATYQVGPGLKRLKLKDLFPEQAVVKALMADGVVKRHLKPGKPPATLAELSKRLAAPNAAVYTFGERGDWMDSFAFHHVRGDQVAVRIALPGGNAAHRTMRTELGVYLPMTAALKAELAPAAARGNLMDRLRAGVAKVKVQRGEAPPEGLER